MIDRARGEHTSPYLRPWRPKRPGHSPSELPEPAELDEPGEPAGLVRSVAAWRWWLPRIQFGRRSRLTTLTLVALALLAAGWTAHSHLSAVPRREQTARQWFDAYMAAAVDNPGRVCHTLFTAALAASYRHRHDGCEAVFRGVSDQPVVVVAVLSGGRSAILELRNRRGAHRLWHVTLIRRDRAWRATGIYAGP